MKWNFEVNYRTPLPMDSYILRFSSSEGLLVHSVFEYDSLLQFGGITIPQLSGIRYLGKMLD